MHIAQLAVEGLRHFSDRTLFGFQGKLDVVRLTNGSHRQSFFDLLFCALHPNSDRLDLGQALAESSSSRARTITTLSDWDNHHYRVLRDLRVGDTSLFQLPTPDGSPELVSSHPDEVRRFLYKKLRFPSDTDYEALFVYTRDGLPSQGDRRHVRSGTKQTPLVPSGPGLFRAGGNRQVTGGGSLRNVLSSQSGSRADETRTHDLATQAKRMSNQKLLDAHNELRQDRRRARRFARARRTLSALDEKSREARAIHSEMVLLQQQLKSTEDALKAQPLMASLPVGFRERWVRHVAVEKEYQANRARVERDLTQIHAVDDASSGRRRRAWYLPLLVTCMMATVVWWGALLWFKTPWFALVQFLMGAAVGGLMYLDVRAKERSARKRTLVAELEDHLKRLERQYVLDTAAVRGLLDRLGIHDTSHLAERLGGYEELVAEKNRLSSLLDGQIGQHGRRAEAVLRRISKRRSECEEVLEYEASSASLDSIERRLKPLEQEIFSRRLTPLEEDDDPDNLPIIKDITDIPSLVRPASVLGGAIPNFDDDDEEVTYTGRLPEVADEGEGADGFSLAPSAYADEGMWCSPQSGPGLSSGTTRSTEYDLGGSGPASADSERPQYLLQCAAQLLGQSVDALVDDELEDRVGRYVREFTQGQYEQVDLEAQPMLLTGRAGRASYGDLEGELLDQVDTGLRWGLLEGVLKVCPAPVIIEDAPLRMSDAQRQKFLHNCQHLSSLSQVIIVTPSADVPGEEVDVGCI